jgi:hypothetical protein
MDFYTILDKVIALLQQRQRVTYRALRGCLKSPEISVLSDEERF